MAPTARKKGDRLGLLFAAVVILGAIATGTCFAVDRSGESSPGAASPTQERGTPAPLPAPVEPPESQPSDPSSPTPRDRRVIDLGDGVEMAFHWCPPGEFMMGRAAGEEGVSDELPQHLVRITKGLWMGETEVTQAQWRAVMGAGNDPSTWKADDLPVDSVSWNDAQAFCRKFSERLRGKGIGVRLPTAAEWEYACRAETTTPFHTGPTISTDQANYDGNDTYAGGRKGVNRQRTTTVKSFAPNAWNLYDMHGNVMEWCQDWYGPYPSAAQTDPKGPPSGEHRVLRGGCWGVCPLDCRSASRHRNTPNARLNFLGFRVSLDSP